MYAAELHCHTTASDGRPSPGEVVRRGRSIGLHALAVTDHNTFTGSVIASREARGLRGAPVIVYGNEVRTMWGDALILCPEPIPEKAWKGMNPWELREAGDEYNCVLVAAHPYHLGRHSVGGRAWDRRVFHTVEVWNSRGLILFNIPAVYRARRIGMTGTSGSDAHVLSELGVAPVMLWDEPRKPVDVVEAIMKGRVRPTYGIPRVRAIVDAAVWGVRRRMGFRVAW
ncbi:MAG: PHP domain-containing protein [Desulfurococcales archaeon]|nr:PHP domain-containing protein [Desulfurococcales archaeon]MCE4605542.1 PHP domain-containing protein [Desulfurococcales archaeon]